MPAPKPLSASFHDKYEMIPEAGCWLWVGAVGGHGYGVLKRQNAFLYAHRVSWQLHHGEIPPEMCVCHHCDIPICVNPDHLFLGTDADNAADRAKKGRGARGERNGSAQLTEESVREILRLRRSGVSRIAVAERFGVSLGHVTKITNRELWGHIDATW